MPVIKNKTKITVIMDNYVQSAGLAAEHGWSVLIESGEDRILFDTGAGKNIINNLKQLGYTPGMINKVFISHGHYDHTGGLYHILRYSGRQIELFSHPDIFHKKYKWTRRVKMIHVGIPFGMDDYSGQGAVFRTAKTPLKISPGIYSTGEIPMGSPFESSDKSFVKKTGGFYRFDDLRDDTGVIIEMQKGLILITGCAHRGLINTIKQAQKVSGKKHLLAVIGGFHLANKNKVYIDKTIAELKNTSLDMIIPAHCTGAEGFCALKQEFGSSCGFGYAGRQMIFDDR